MSRLSLLAAGFLCITAAAQQTEPQPISVGIVFDTSRSMGGKLKYSRQLVNQFLMTARQKDEFFLVESGDHLGLTSVFSANPGDVQNHLTFIQSSGRSPVLDGIYMAVYEMRNATNSRKLILVISDGANNNSQHGNREVENAARDAGVEIYTIGIFEAPAIRARSPEELAGPSMLSDLSERTGGKQFAVDTSLGALPDVGIGAGTEMRAPRARP
jgi:Ca-activated chloride channel family protein